MLIIIISWIVLSLILYSFGDIFVMLWNNVTKTKSVYGLFDSFLLGLAVISTITLFVSLVYPINIHVFLCLAVVSVLYYIIYYKKIVHIFKNALKFLPSLSNISIIFLFITLITILFASISTPFHGDYGSYHLPVIKWTSEYRIIPGLGNLHGRYAFNSAFLPLCTLFSGSHISNVYFFSLNSLCVLLFSAYIINLADKTVFILAKVSYLFILVLILFLYGVNLSSTSTDLLPGIAIIYLLFKVINDKSDISDKLLLYAFIPLFCITVKLSSFPIILLAAGALYCNWKQKRSYKEIVVIMTIGALMIFPWIFRFIVLSGYLIYPFPAIDLFDFDWKMPKEMVYDEMDLAYSWARSPGIIPKEVLSKPFYEWIPQWFVHQNFVLKGVYILTFISFMFVLINKGKYLQKNGKNLFAWIISLCGILFFLQAPDFRFGFGFVLPCTFIPFIIQKFRLHSMENTFNNFIYIGCCFILLNYTVPRIFTEVKTWKIYDTDYGSYMIQPQSDVELKSFLRSLELPVSEKNIDGIIFYEEIYCFDRCLPCTGYINEGLKPRGTSVQDGFMIEKGVKSYGGFFGSYFEIPSRNKPH